MPWSFFLVIAVAVLLLAGSLGLTIRAFGKSKKASAEYALKAPGIIQETKSGHVATFGKRPDDLNTGNFPTLPRNGAHEKPAS